MRRELAAAWQPGEPVPAPKYNDAEHEVWRTVSQSLEELHERLTRLVMAPAYARGLAETARVWVAESRMDAYQVRDRVRWYRSLLDRRDELTRALFERVPELAP